MKKQTGYGSEETGKYGIWIISTTRISLECLERLDGRGGPKVNKREQLIFPFIQVGVVERTLSREFGLCSALD